MRMKKKKPLKGKREAKEMQSHLAKCRKLTRIGRL